MRSMTSQGSPHTRFRRAVSTGNPLLVRAAAAELSWVNLADALAVCLVFAEADEEHYSRSAAKFIARYVFELPGVHLGAPRSDRRA